MTVSPRDENGGEAKDAPYDFVAAWLIQSDETGAYATVQDLISSIMSAAMLQLVVSGDETLREWFGIKDDNGPQIIKTGKLWADAMRGKPNRAGEVWQTGTDFLAEMGAIKITAASKKALDTALASSKTLIQLNALATASDYKYAPNRTLTVQTTLDEMLGERIEGYASLSKSAKSKRRAKVKEEILSLAFLFGTSLLFHVLL